MADDSDDKTEDPTGKRLEEAGNRGEVGKSQGVNTRLVIAAATLLMAPFSGSIAGTLMMPLRNLIENSWMIHPDGPGLLTLARGLMFAVVSAIGIPILMLMFAAIGANLLQHRLVWSTKPLTPDF